MLPVFAGFCYLAAVQLLAEAIITMARFSRDVAEIARQEGKEWCFWNDGRKLVRFLRLPEQLIDPSDAPRLVVAKRALVDQRTRVIRRGVVALLLISLAIGLTTPFPFYGLLISYAALLLLLARGIL
jgi:hypothetical protein